MGRTCYPSDQYYYGMDWFDAMQCCYYQQAYLAEPTSEEEQSQINAYISICEYQCGTSISYLILVCLHHCDLVAGYHQQTNDLLCKVKTYLLNCSLLLSSHPRAAVAQANGNE